MVMRNDLVRVLDEERLGRLIADAHLRDALRSAYRSPEKPFPQVYDITITTLSGVKVDCRFTAMAIFEVTNQTWVRSIEPWHDCRMG